MVGVPKKLRKGTTNRHVVEENRTCHRSHMDRKVSPVCRENPIWSTLLPLVRFVFKLDST